VQTCAKKFNVDEWLPPKPDKKPEFIPSVFLVTADTATFFAGQQLTSYPGG
jgi:hypothetical protein